MIQTIKPGYEAGLRFLKMIQRLAEKITSGEQFQFPESFQNFCLRLHTETRVENIKGSQLFESQYELQSTIINFSWSFNVQQQ